MTPFHNFIAYVILFASAILAGATALLYVFRVFMVKDTPPLAKLLIFGTTMLYHVLLGGVLLVFAIGQLYLALAPEQQVMIGNTYFLPLTALKDALLILPMWFSMILVGRFVRDNLEILDLMDKNAYLQELLSSLQNPYNEQSSIEQSSIEQSSIELDSIELDS